MRRLAALAAALATAATCACTSAQPGRVAPGASDRTLRLTMVGDLSTMDPLARSEADGTDVDLLVYGYFYEVDNKLRPVPDLATAVPTRENGGISADGLTLTYHLRRGVKWQDGAPFSARDVVATIEAIQSPKNTVASRKGWDDIASAQAIGDDEVRIRLKKLYAPAPATFFCESGLYPVLPAHVLARYPDVDRVPFATAPVGTGPYRLARWNRGQSIELVANPLYWRGRPSIERIDYEIAPTTDAALAQLEDHGADAWLRVPPSLYDDVKRISGYRVSSAPSLAYTHLDLNQENPLFDDVRVRRAIDDAIDRDAVVSKALDGAADAAWTDVSPLSWAYDTKAKHPAPDPARARALLRSAGWAPGPDGILRKGSTAFSFAISTAAQSAAGVAIESVLRQELRDVGIETTIKNYPSTQFFASYDDNGILFHGRYDAALFSWTAGADPDDSSEYMCDQIPPAGQNDLFWCDDRFDAAERGALSTYDESARKRYYAVTQAELASQAPTIVLDFARQIFVTPPGLRGFSPSPAASSNWNAWEWSI